MKNIRYSMFAAAAALAIALPLAAQASDGTITFDGSITSQTCDINGGSRPQDFTVHLPQGLSASSLNTAVGATAGKTLFTIALSNCTPGSATTIFEAGATVDPSTHQLINTTGNGYANNVQVQLLDGLTDQKILIGSQVTSPSNTQGASWVLIAAGNATLNYYAQYISTGTVGPGLVNTSVVYDVIYM